MRTGECEKLSVWVKCICSCLLSSVTHSPGLIPRESESGCGWKGPLDVNLSSPAQAVHLEQALWTTESPGCLSLLRVEFLNKHEIKCLEGGK